MFMLRGSYTLTRAINFGSLRSIRWELDCKVHLCASISPSSPNWNSLSTIPRESWSNLFSILIFKKDAHAIKWTQNEKKSKVPSTQTLMYLVGNVWQSSWLSTLFQLMSKWQNEKTKAMKKTWYAIINVFVKTRVIRCFFHSDFM